MNLAFKDLDRDVQHYHIQINQLFNNLLKRCDEFLDTHVTIWRMDLLLDAKKFQNEFINNVLIDISIPLDNILNDMSILISLRGKTQAKAILDFIGDRPKRYSKGIIGIIKDENFDSIRYELMEKLRRDVKVVIDKLEQEKESSLIRQQVSIGFMQAAGLQGASVVAMIGLGFAQLLDITGIVTLSSAMAAGFIIIPWRRNVIR